MDKYKIPHNDCWSNVVITPGTKFMEKLDKSIREFINSHSEKAKIVYSSYKEEGEGEHKIFDFIRQNPEEHNDSLNTVIYGLDADLIMLSINHLPVCPNIFLFRETPQFIQSINSDLEPNENYVLDIPELSNNIAYYMTTENSDMTIDRTTDYIFLCFLLGNDFLPHFPSMNIRTHGIQVLLDVYVKYIANNSSSFLITKQTKEIDWPKVFILIKHIALNEQQLLVEEYSVRDKFDNKKRNI